MINYRAMAGPGKGVEVEVWPVAVDDRDHTGIWLLDRQAWRTGPIPAAATEWDAALAVLQDHAARPAVLHQTSTRDEGETAVHTFVVCIDLSDGLEPWPDAQPIITGRFLESAGGPILVEATEAPLPRYLDVLLHGVRHLALLAHGVQAGVRRIGVDGAVRDALSPEWLAWLAPLEPALASLYHSRRVPAA